MLVIVMVIVAFALDSLIAMAFVAADFFIRGFTKMKFSPLSFVAYWITQVLNLPARPIDKAPKIFAARMGFVMSLAFAVFFAAQIGTASAVIAGILVLPFYKN